MGCGVDGLRGFLVQREGLAGADGSRLSAGPIFNFLKEFWVPSRPGGGVQEGWSFTSRKGGVYREKKVGLLLTELNLRGVVYTSGWWLGPAVCKTAQWALSACRFMQLGYGPVKLV